MITFIQDYLLVEGKSPTYREMAKRLNSAPGSAYARVERLIKDGVLERKTERELIVLKPISNMTRFRKAARAAMRAAGLEPINVEPAAKAIRETLLGAK